MSSDYIYNYLDDIWSLMSEQDRMRFAETWKAYEQTYGDVWMQMFERQLAVNIDYLPLYNIRRWNKYYFNTSTQLLRAARYRSGQDLSLGINLENRYLIKIEVDSDPAVEIDLRGLVPGDTKLSEIVTRVNTLLNKTVAFAVSSGQLLEFRSPTVGPASRIKFLPASDPARDASEAVLGFDPVNDLPKSYPKFPYEYLLPDALIVGVPKLQDKIKEDLVTLSLITGTDFTVEFGTGAISFASPPPESLWAPDTFFNNETPYNNYGYLLGIYDQNKEGYLKAVKGMWYAFWTGPRPENIRRSLYLLFGLPTASGPGVVTNVTDLEVSLLYDDGTTETFQVPADLSPIVAFGQRVERFEPLINGIRVFDKVNYPGFVEKEVGRFGIQPFLTQNASRGVDPNSDESRALKMLEANTYLPQIDVATFISPDIKLSNVRTFLSTLQPKSRTYLFQVLVGKFREKISILDEGLTGNPTPDWPNGDPSLGLAINFDATPNFDWNPNTEVDQTQLDESENNDYTYLRLDEGWCTADRIGVDVYHSMSLVDSFTIEG